MLAAGVAVVFASAVLVAFGVLRDTDPALLLRDPAASFRFPVYGGVLSHLGVALLGATAAITLFVGAVLRDVRGLFLYVGSFSALLALDDLFMLHEHVGPNDLGLPEIAFYALYAGLGLPLLVRLVRQTGARRSRGILVSLGFLGLSAATDLLVPDEAALRIGAASVPQTVFEDLFKLAGWAAWFGFWTAQAVHAVSTRLAPDAPRASPGECRTSSDRAAAGTQRRGGME